MTALTFRTDSEKYEEIPNDVVIDKRGKVVRSNTMTGTTTPAKKEKASSGSKWGYGFGLGKKKEAEAEAAAEANLQRGLSQRTLPVYQATSQPPTRQNSQSTQASKRSHDTHRTHRSHESHDTSRSKSSKSARPVRPAPYGITGYRASQDTLVQSDSIYRRKAEDVASIREVKDTSQQLADMREQMAREKLDI